MSSCPITPIEAFQSTNLNSKIDSFGRLADRIVRAIGAPLVSVESHQDQIFENIAIACEMFSKYAGYTKEYLILDSALYEKGRGIRLDYLYTLANGNFSLREKVTHKTESPDTAPYLLNESTFFISVSSLNKVFFALSPELSASFSEGLERNLILDTSSYITLVSAFSSNPTLNIIPISSYFIPSHTNSISMNGVVDTKQPTLIYNNMFDYDVMDYRKVIAVTNFEEGSTTGVNTLFTIEQTLAQQTYFSYAMGNYGFDLISWYTVKNWLETREKVLALKRSYEFNDRTQYLRIYPEPTDSVRFYGVLDCYIEKPVRDLIKEQWVYQYALALTKIGVGYVRGKFNGVNIFGGQAWAADIKADGITERDKLEEHLYTNASGLGDSDPCTFICG
jgi:hypothetical protein